MSTQGELGVKDIRFTCKKPDCQAEDVWERGEQKFMLQLQTEGKVDSIKMPTLCRKCRAERKAAKAQQQSE